MNVIVLPVWPAETAAVGVVSVPVAMTWLSTKQTETLLSDGVTLPFVVDRTAL